MWLFIGLCAVIMRMSSASPWGRIPGLTLSSRNGGIKQCYVPWFKCFSMENPPDIFLLQLGFTWLKGLFMVVVTCIAGLNCCTLLLSKTANQSTREMNFIWEKWGNSFVIPLALIDADKIYSSVMDFRLDEAVMIISLLLKKSVHFKKEHPKTDSRG